MTLWHAIRTLTILLVLSLAGATGARADSLASFLPDLDPAELAPGAEGFGPIREDVPVAPVLKGGETVAWAFLTSDFVGTTGYSGKPIHVVAAIDTDAVLTGVKLVKHSEPIVLIGIPNSKMVALTEGYAGLDLKAEVESGGQAHDLDIISGATVTIMVIDDSLVRGGIKVARALGLGGLSPVQMDGPRRELDPGVDTVRDWTALSGDGSIRRLTLDVGQVNAAFAETGDERAIARPERGQPGDTFIDMHMALVSVPAIGRSLLGEQEYANLTDWLEPGEHAILVLGRGTYSFKGSGYVRGGIFDRIQLIQGDRSVRFFDRQHRRLGALATADSPSFTELDLFKIPAGAEFDPAEPFRLQLLVQRAVGAVEKVFLTFDLDYRLPESYLKPLAAPQVVDDASAESAAKTALWQRIWRDRTVEIAGLGVMLAVLTATFFFQFQATMNARVFFWFRMSFLTASLVFLGWYANAQLSVVNLMALAGSLRSGFTWDAFLMDPLVFIQWFAVAAALLFWGRGAYCGWLCPFGALQELTNRIGRALKIPQWTLPWGLHERLWPLKYMIFLGLFGLSMVSIPLAEKYAEIEPFKTAIILKFVRDWPFVVFAVSLLVIGLFIERFYCRYICPLGGALAIPARMRMFDWLRRYKECGNPCQTCANECPVQAIHPTGEINPNECVDCLHCQVLYQSEAKCPVVIRQLKRRAKVGRAELKMPLGDAPAGHPNAKPQTVS
ncbi:NosR/NirI family transcriptional regulator, nitrous oxide reductase regulator [Cribrihabitans marinus]|uniref:NosR/NirI family transcriptional regulator, nitrous oxide reductase regulator n=1 Tax=Cribrihabitans marinus TaxID=1227549 RepID=A0A1H7DUP4_9RHOB|nr:NosR/NirI family protein [Cribrihabitans marinus]SEK03010.1 NosR/NirI family transcriptional regulator, nitrous oxide reductase regulator [Cribrihabitans marinus]